MDFATISESDRPPSILSKTSSLVSQSVFNDADFEAAGAFFPVDLDHLDEEFALEKDCGEEYKGEEMKLEEFGKLTDEGQGDDLLRDVEADDEGEVKLELFDDGGSVDPPLPKLPPPPDFTPPVSTPVLQPRPASGPPARDTSTVPQRPRSQGALQVHRDKPPGTPPAISSFRRNRFIGKLRKGGSTGNLLSTSQESEQKKPEATSIYLEEVQIATVPRNRAVMAEQRSVAEPENREQVSVELVEEFEEDMMGEAREWQDFSAKPEDNEDEESEEESEFPITSTTDRVRVKETGEKQFTSLESTESHPMLRSAKPQKSSKRSQKIDLKTRKMIAEAKSTGAKVEKSPSHSPILPAESERKPSLESEWDAATSRALQEIAQKPAEEAKTALVRFREIWPAFEKVEVRRELAMGKRQGRSWLVRCCMGDEEELEEVLQVQIRRIHALQQLSLTSSQRDTQLLQSVWKLYTTTAEDCPRFGSHWAALGFQGTDPATDLRSMGMFGLLQMLFFVSTYQQEASVVAGYARGRGNFPFAAVSLNMTKIAVDALREERLHPIIQRERNVYDTVMSIQVNFFYAAVFLSWFNLYQSGNCDVSRIGFLNVEVTKEAKKNPERMLRSLRTGAMKVR